MPPTRTATAPKSPPHSPLARESKPTTIVLVHAGGVNGLGDNVIALSMLLALRQIYRARLVVFARDVLQNLLEGLRLSDAYCLLEGELTNPINCKHINAYHPTYLISLSHKREELAFFASTNAQTIITRAKLANIFHPRFRTLLPPSPSTTHREILLLLARLVDKRAFDSGIESVDFLESRVQTQAQKAELHAFFTKELERLGRKDYARDTSLKAKVAFTRRHRASLRSKNAFLLGHDLAYKPTYRTLKDTQAASLDSIPPSPNLLSPNPLSQSSSHTPLFLIGINPFSISAQHNLRLAGYLKLLERIAALPYCIPCVCSYGSAHEELLSALADYNATYKTHLQERLLLYHNRASLHHLACFLESLSLLITGSTGALHLAENLYTPTIALVSHINTKRWGSQDKRYVLIQTPLNRITQAEEDAIIEATLQALQELITGAMP